MRPANEDRRAGIRNAVDLHIRLIRPESGVGVAAPTVLAVPRDAAAPGVPAHPRRADVAVGVGCATPIEEALGCRACDNSSARHVARAIGFNHVTPRSGVSGRIHQPAGVSRRQTRPAHAQRRGPADAPAGAAVGAVREGVHARGAAAHAPGAAARVRRRHVDRIDRDLRVLCASGIVRAAHAGPVARAVGVARLRALAAARARTRDL